jgi:hypothetical protein
MTDWISWFNFGVPALVGVSLLLSSLGRRHRRLQLWREALAQCGLTEEKSSGFWTWRPKLTARSGAIKIWIADARGKGDEVHREQVPAVSSG